MASNGPFSGRPTTSSSPTISRRTPSSKTPPSTGSGRPSRTWLTSASLPTFPSDHRVGQCVKCRKEVEGQGTQCRRCDSGSSASNGTQNSRSRLNSTGLVDSVRKLARSHSSGMEALKAAEGFPPPPRSSPLEPSPENLSQSLNYSPSTDLTTYVKCKSCGNMFQIHRLQYHEPTCMSQHGQKGRHPHIAKPVKSLRQSKDGVLRASVDPEQNRLTHLPDSPLSNDKPRFFPDNNTPPPSSPPKEDLQIPGSAEGSSEKGPISEEPTATLTPCQHCGRSFQTSRIKYHESVCTRQREKLRWDKRGINASDERARLRVQVRQSGNLKFRRSHSILSYAATSESDYASGDETNKFKFYRAQYRRKSTRVKPNTDDESGDQGRRSQRRSSINSSKPTTDDEGDQASIAPVSDADSNPDKAKARNSLKRLNRRRKTLVYAGTGSGASGSGNTSSAVEDDMEPENPENTEAEAAKVKVSMNNDELRDFHLKEYWEIRRQAQLNRQRLFNDIAGIDANEVSDSNTEDTVTTQIRRDKKKVMVISHFEEGEEKAGLDTAPNMRPVKDAELALTNASDLVNIGSNISSNPTFSYGARPPSACSSEDPEERVLPVPAHSSSQGRGERPVTPPAQPLCPTTSPPSSPPITTPWTGSRGSMATGPSESFDRKLPNKDHPAIPQSNSTDWIGASQATEVLEESPKPLQPPTRVETPHMSQMPVSRAKNQEPLQASLMRGPRGASSKLSKSSEQPPRPTPYHSHSKLSTLTRPHRDSDHEGPHRSKGDDDNLVSGRRKSRKSHPSSQRRNQGGATDGTQQTRPRPPVSPQPKHVYKHPHANHNETMTAVGGTSPTNSPPTSPTTKRKLGSSMGPGKWVPPPPSLPAGDGHPGPSQSKIEQSTGAAIALYGAPNPSKKKEREFTTQAGSPTSRKRRDRRSRISTHSNQESVFATSQGMAHLNAGNRQPNRMTSPLPHRYANPGSDAEKEEKPTYPAYANTSMGSNARHKPQGYIGKQASEALASVTATQGIRPRLKKAGANPFLASISGAKKKGANANMNANTIVDSNPNPDTNPDTNPDMDRQISTTAGTRAEANTDGEMELNPSTTATTISTSNTKPQPSDTQKSTQGKPSTLQSKTTCAKFKPESSFRGQPLFTSPTNNARGHGTKASQKRSKPFGRGVGGDAS